MPPTKQVLPGPQNYPPPTESGGQSPQSEQANREQPQAQEMEQPPPTDAQPQPQGDPVRPPEPPATPENRTQAYTEDQALNTDSPKPQDARQQLQHAIDQSNEVLATAHTIAPLFADIFTIDRAKITVMRKGLFGAAEVMSIRVEDLLNASAAIGMLFGTLKLANRVAANSVTEIGPFWRSDALRMKRITQGYVIALQKEIDVSNLTTNELESMLERLGEDDHPNVLSSEPSG